MDVPVCFSMRGAWMRRLLGSALIVAEEKLAAVMMAGIE
jgi:hypothetical protein